VGHTNWSNEELQHLEDKWGSVSVSYLSKTLNRSVYGILNQVHRQGLGKFLDSGGYITINQLFKALGRQGGCGYTVKHWIEKQNMPVKNKKRLNATFKVIYLNDFWNWAEEYRMWINFAKVEVNALGAEPDWVKDQRKADIEFSKYKIEPWTEKEDALLKSYLKMYKYSYRDLSIQMKRTVGALKRRMVDLKLMERPLREPAHSVWTDKEIETVIRMYNKGYRSPVIQEYIEKSASAIEGKIERLIRDGYLTKRK
jgi:hypothetical protein